MAKKPMFRHSGYCDICDTEVEFTARHAWFRDHLVCPSCRSVPRERALMRVLKRYYPAFADLRIHESSPGDRGVSARLSRDCRNYSFSHYLPNVPYGKVDQHLKARCESLEALTFASQSFDLFITQDVMEHILHPEAAFREIARVLRPGGAHIFTVPLVKKAAPSAARAVAATGGTIRHLANPEYHGNPVDDKGSLVTMDWGYDILASIERASGMSGEIVTIDDIERGIRAEFIDVVICFKL